MFDRGCSDGLQNVVGFARGQRGLLFLGLILEFFVMFRIDVVDDVFPDGSEVLCEELDVITEHGDGGSTSDRKTDGA